MAKQAGVVQSLQGGKFFVKDEAGNIKELKVQDIINENDTVYGDSSNTQSAKIEILLDGQDVIVLMQGQQQLIDSSLLETAFGSEELFFTRGDLEQILEAHRAMTDVESDLREAKFKGDKNITDEETTEGEEEVEDETAESSTFALRDGSMTDVISDLRKKLFQGNINLRKEENALGEDFRLPKSHILNEAQNNQINQNNMNKPLGENPSNPFTPPSITKPTNPNRPTEPNKPVDNTPTRPESEGPNENITPETPRPIVPENKPIVPAKLSVDDVTMYEQDGYMVFTVTLDKPAQGDISFDFKTSDGTAISGKDYESLNGRYTISSGSSSITIKVPIKDDFIYENKEQFKVTISNPNGNVSLEKPEGIGTILDNPPVKDSPITPNSPDSSTGTYGEEDTVYAIIVGDKTVNEGDKSSYTIKLVDKDGNPVVVDKNTDVTVVYKNISTQDNDTQYKNGDKITVTIPKGSSEVKFEVQTKDDFYADNGENFNLSIEKVDTNEFENVVIGDKNGKNKDVTTEILDNTTTNPNNPSTNEKEQEQVVLKIVAADKDGNPIKGTDGNYLTQNEVPEGSDVYYVVLAFKPDTTTFNDSTKLPIQEGKVEVETSNKTASGVNSQTKDDGTEDYISKKEIVELGKPISVKTLDDWKSDNNEQFEIKITDKTYQHPSTPVYENVKTDTNPVITTIKDDTDTTPNNPNDNKIETNQEQVILKIVACDSTGNPIIVNGKYTFANEVAEGSNAKYMVLAFHPNTTEFKTTDKLDVQDGKVTIKTADDTAKTTGTKDNAELDYKSETTKEVTLGTVFEVETLDDYLADNNETFKVSINDSSYKHPSTPIYENVKTDTNPVTTTIKDNTTTNPNQDSSTETNGMEKVILKIVAADSSGNPMKDGSGNYLTVNEAVEGENAYYVVLAFDPKATNFNDTTKLPIQQGSVEIETFDKTAIGTKTQTKDDGSQDYISKKEIFELGKVITVKTLDDWKADNGEQYEVKITDKSYQHPSIPVYENVKTDPKPVTTTILDNPVNNPSNGTPGTPTEPGGYGQEDTVYAIITGAITVNEGNTTTYTVKLVDKDGNAVVVTNPTTVTVKYTNITTQDGDTQFNNNNTITVTIPANGSSNTFTVESIDDYFADNGEKYNVAITKVDTNEFENVVIGDKNGNNKNVTTTILDNPSTTEQPTIPTDPSNPNNPDDGISYGQEDTVYAIITGATTVNEGNTTTYTVKLVDKDGNAVVVTNPTTVTVRYTNVTTQDGDTEYNNNNTITVTIPANGSSNTFTVESIDDYFADNGEKYNVAITKVDTNEFENVVIGDKNGNNKDVTTTILDDTDNTPNNPNDGVESNHESVIIKLVACDASGNPILEADGKTYKIVNEVNEGDNAKYMALAFEPNSTTFTTETKLSLQGGTVTVDTSNGTAVGVTTQTKEDGSEDFILVKDKVVNIGVAFEVVTVDDYISDNNEIYTVSINSGSYTHPTTPIYENVTINNEAVTTTIKDNSNPVDNTTPHNPNDPTNHNQESDKEIVIIKLFAADENGNVIKDGNGNYLLANEAEEGTNANYIAYAFENGTTTFNDSTKLSVQTGTIDISFQNDTATGAPTKTLTDGTQDFNNTPKTSVSIGQSFSTKVFRDLASESTEKYKVVIDSNSYSGNYESVNIDTTPVTTTIHDEKLFVKIEAITDTTNEGGNLKYKVVIVNKDGEEVKVPAGKSLTVDLNYEGNTSKQATENTDYTPVTSVTISAGTSYTEFEIVTKDDYYAEGDEGLKITINNIDNSSNAFENIASHTVANGALSNKITATGTIKDNPAKIDEPTIPLDPNNPDNPDNGDYGQEDTVYAIITGTQTIKEGNISTNYTVKLVDKDGKTVAPTKDTKITVTYNHYTDGKPTQDDDTQYNNGNTIEVTILENQTEATFTVQTKDDVYKDDGEQFNLTITNIQNTGEFENIKIGDKDGNQKNVITTIKDNTNPGTETNVDPVSIVLVALEKGQILADITDADGKLIYTNTNTTPESGKLYYVAVAVDGENKVLVQSGKVTVNTVDITGGAKGSISTTPKIDGSEDYQSLKDKEVSLGEVFEVQTNDDYVRDNNETFTVKITDVVDTNYESPSIDTTKDTVTSTITDNPAKVNQPDTGTGNDDPTNGNYGKTDTVYVKITQTPSTVEGGDLVHTITLVDKNGDPVTVPAGQTVTVNLTYSANNSGSFTESDLSTIVKSVTITGGKSSENFTNTAKDDFTYEGDEVYNVTISSVTQSGAFENVAIHTDNTTTGTIKDGVTIYKDGAYIDPENAIVDEDKFDVTDSSSTISNKDGNASDGVNTYQGEYLNIIKPNTDDNYSLVFHNTINIYSGDKDSTTAFDYGDLRGTNLQSGGVNIEYVISGNTIIGYQGSGRADEDKVFEIILNKDDTIRDTTNKLTSDSYTYTQYKNIDHPIGGTVGTTPGIDDNITLEFGFKITDQDSTSDVVKFKVTVNDSLPKATDWTENVNEDGSVDIVISPENFLEGKIGIRVKTTDSFTTLSKNDTIRVVDPNDSNKDIGTLTNKGDGTVTFVPDSDYSNYDAKPWFEYAVSDFDGDNSGARVNINVKPVADAPTIFVKDITTTEDAGNTLEGTNKVDLGLKTPLLSKDSEEIQQTTPTDYTAENNDNNDDKYNSISTPDQNTTRTGDNPERNGEITLTFTNGDKLKNLDGTVGAKIFKVDGTTQVGTDITTANQTLKVIIIKDGTVDYDYHHKGITITDINTPPAGTVYLTKSEYESLQIQHAEDNDTDIKISIKVTSYEVDDNGKPLNANDSTYSDKTNTNLSNTTTADMTVKINPITDEIELKFDGASNTGTLTYKDETGVDKILSGNITNKDSGTANEITFTNKIKEGSGAIDLKSILSNTSGALNGTGGTKGDLDGSEKRTYTITGIPEGTIVKIGSTEAVAGKDGKATLTFKDAENKELDPTFTMKFPDTFGGGVNAKIELSVYDKGADSTDTAGTPKTQTVYLNIDVEPVPTQAKLDTFQVSQAIGYEDAGRSKGNDLNANANIDQPANGIPLNIKVSSTDTDGSETANVRIGDIPNGSALYVFDKSLDSGTGKLVLVDKDFVSTGNITVTQNGDKYTVEIKDYQNDKAPKFIPPHNDDADANLKVSVQFVDTVTYNGGTTKTETGAWSSTKDIDVIVKNVADAPVGTSLKDTGLVNINGSSYIKATEDTLFNLKDVYKTPASLASSDSSEELTVRVKLKDGFTISNGSPYFIDNGEYVVKASDINAGNIKIVPPANFSGTTIFDLTYVTTEKAGENDSKTWYTQNVGIFVEPKADDVTIASGSTIYEDNQGGAGNGGNKIDLKPTLTDTGTTNGTETVEGVKILASSVPAGYTLYSDSSMTTPLTPTGAYYVLTKAQWENGIYAKNSTPELVSGDFTLKVTYSVKDTNGASSDTQDYTHDHTVTVKAVTDQPILDLGTIEGTDVTIDNTNKKVTVNSETTSTFTIPVTTLSDDKDSSEKVQEIVISGVPKGVEVVGATYYGYSGSEHNGIWVISNPSDKNLDSDGASQSIQFIVNKGADFESRPITITIYTKDEATADTKIESDTKTFTLDKSYIPTGTTGNPPLFNLSTKPAIIYEDNDNKVGAIDTDDIYNLGKSITVTNSGGGTAGNWAITITDFPEGTKVEGKEGVNIYTYEQGGKTHYVITGTTTTGNVADINTALSNVIVTPPKDMNTGGDKNGQMTFNATISTSHNGTYYQGTPIKDYKNDITPVTDEMTVSVVANNTNEDTATPLTITLSNPSDGSKTELIGNSITIKIDETWKDDATGGVGTKGTLTDPSGKYNIVDNGDDTYTITPKNAVNNFKVDTPISGLVYTPAKDRDGDVKFEVSVQNKEGNSIILTSKGDTTIKVNPVVDMKPEVTVVTATGTEDTAVTVGSTTLANAVKLNVTPKTGETFDSSEKFTNIVLDEVPNGFTVWYKVGSDLVMATNIGKSGGADFDLTPNISGDALTHRNKWLIPVDSSGAMPEIYINAPENWAGDFDFKAQFTLKEQNLTTTEKTVVDVSGKITPVADGVTIDPTNTFGKAFEWIDLKLNANMKDVDGSETMSLELSGLGANAQFKISGTDTLVSAVYSDNKWTLSGIKYDEINKIQFTNDKDVNSVGVKAWTVEAGMLPTDTGAKSSEVNSTFNLDIKDVGGILELDKGINLDFSKLETTSLKGINSIDLGSSNGKNELLNLTLKDVLDMTNNKGELIIKGCGAVDNQDKVTFANNNGWSKGSTETIDGKTFDIYSNSQDSSVKVKVETNINDQII